MKEIIEKTMKMNHPEIVDLNRYLTNIKYSKIKYQNYISKCKNIISVQQSAVSLQLLQCLTVQKQEGRK